MDTASILVSNYNYAEFLDRALGSALAQGAAVREIIVVDDGSTDGSPERIRAWQSKDRRLRLIEQPNGGQLSAMNRAFEVSTGELLFFLDADDEYLPGYVDRILQVYRENPTADFAYCRWRAFGGSSGTFSPEGQGPSRCFGPTFWRTLATREGIGGPTSTLSMRRRLAAHILPCRLAADWRVRADDVLVYGASLCGSLKLHLAEVWIGYRVHDRNHWHGRPDSLTDRAHYEHRRDLLFSHFLQPLNAWCSLKVRMDGLPRLLTREFCLQPQPSSDDLKAYQRSVIRHRGTRKLGGLWKMLRHYRRLRSKVPRSAPATQVPA